MTPFEYVQRTYAVPACRGRRVRVYGRPAVIVEDRGHHLGITYDDARPGVVHSAHPTDGVEYLEEVVQPRRVSRSARRYQVYLNGDTGLTFREWLDTKMGKASV